MNIAKTYARLNDVKKAKEYYNNYLKHANDDEIGG